MSYLLLYFFHSRKHSKLRLIGLATLNATGEKIPLLGLMVLCYLKCNPIYYVITFYQPILVILIFFLFVFAEINLFYLVLNDFICCSEKRFVGSWNDSDYQI